MFLAASCCSAAFSGVRRRNEQADVRLDQGCRDFLGRRLIGEECIDLRQMTETHHGIAAEFGVVGGKKNLAGIIDDGASDAHLPLVEVEQCPFIVDARNADDAEIHLELPNKIYGRLTDDAEIA